jgi:hypothetical protein
MNVLNLPIHGIVVTLDGVGGGSIVSNLKDGDPLDYGEDEYMGSVDAIEGLILAHACAGIDVTDPKYVGGVQTALDKIAMNYL